jgi:hypothetical protein
MTEWLLAVYENEENINYIGDIGRESGHLNSRT